MSSAKATSFREIVPENDKFLSCFFTGTQKMVLQDPALRQVLSKPATSATRCFGLRYGRYGGCSVSPPKDQPQTPIDVLDLAFYLYRREKNVENLQKSIEALQSQGRLSKDALIYSQWILHPAFPTFVTMWNYSFLGYVLIGFVVYWWFHNVTYTLNALIMYRVILDTLSGDARSITFNAFLHTILFFLDLFISFRTEKWYRMISIIPLLTRFALAFVYLQFGDRTDISLPQPATFTSSRFGEER